ncbi:DUF397 domain-containing protein [Streptomyces lavendulae]|uniref:Uncharacterized protein n=1 Tax=Streptomyces lavendulae subsp. lavendulae TaxID=58340 RepID=A0A2K8PHW7_STRLA|nr:DUF397 domain-containing protein [Streptomyces lavendulae]ATZ25225.1 hypothetical protein SLAV_16875 [Streptomyces lavendulae subsp. lavendulae]QUQ55055.1 hypothetical protein SLLC_14940 [Streptomyces lavendulae subsp. lavendulae]GLV87237.1 DUF397 domain-containing protein [Streptomyces lavendulae subsp. lavendulae]
MEIQWRKSSKSTDAEGNCLEVAILDGEILMRESDDPSVIIRTSRAKLRAFIEGAAAGEFDDLA